MSKTLNQNVKIWRDFEHKLGATLLHRNSDMGKNDILLMAKAISLNTCCCYEALGCVDQPPHRLLTVFRQHDLRKLASFNKEAVLRFTRCEVDDSYTGFKHWCEANGIDCSLYFGSIVRPIRSFFQKPNPVDLAPVLQFLVGWSRIKVDSYDYTHENLSQYIKTEERLKLLSVPKPIVDALNHIIKKWFRDFPIELGDLERHGNGAVADLVGKQIGLKYDLLSTDPLLYYCTGEVPSSSSSHFSRVSRTVFVPKTLLGDRVISMEPVTLQYWQQKIARSMDRWFQNHPTLKHAIHLHDQRFNMNAARLGSEIGSGIATIDLSSASDSVSWDLVKAIFRGTPIMRWLYATRSRSTELVGGIVIPLAKFAPMGSSLCFPIECLVFSAIAELAYQVARVQHDKRISSCGFLVYGDDIIVPTLLWNTIRELLEVCGFNVNTHKSYQHDRLHFRESCGGEYFQGFDVTPIRLPRRFTSLCNDTKGKITVNPTGFDQRIDICNRLFARGLRVSRKLVLDELLALPRPLRPIFGLRGVFSDQVTNHHLIAKYNEDYQDWFVKHGSSYSTTEAGHDDNRYYHWFHLSSSRKRLEEPIVSKSGATTTKFGSRVSPRS